MYTWFLRYYTNHQEDILWQKVNLYVRVVRWVDHHFLFWFHNLIRTLDLYVWILNPNVKQLNFSFRLQLRLGSIFLIAIL